jgi:hypothetical protein
VSEEAAEESTGHEDLSDEELTKLDEIEAAKRAADELAARSAADDVRAQAREAYKSGSDKKLRAVTVEEVWLCASGKPCCNGRGYFVMRSLPNKPDPSIIKYRIKSEESILFGSERMTSEFEHRKTCPCALGRFFRKNPEVVRDDKGHAWWPPASIAQAPEGPLAPGESKIDLDLRVAKEAEAARKLGHAAELRKEADELLAQAAKWQEEVDLLTADEQKEKARMVERVADCDRRVSALDDLEKTTKAETLSLNAEVLRSWEETEKAITELRRKHEELRADRAERTARSATMLDEQKQSREMVLREKAVLVAALEEIERAVIDKSRKPRKRAAQLMADAEQKKIRAARIEERNRIEEQDKLSGGDRLGD